MLQRAAGRADNKASLHQVWKKQRHSIKRLHQPKRQRPHLSDVQQLRIRAWSFLQREHQGKSNSKYLAAQLSQSCCYSCLLLGDWFLCFAIYDTWWIFIAENFFSELQLSSSKEADVQLSLL